MLSVLRQTTKTLLTSLPVRPWRLRWVIVLIVGFVLTPLAMMLVGAFIDDPALAGIAQRVVTICAIIILVAVIHGRVTRDDFGLASSPHGMQSLWMQSLTILVLTVGFVLFVEGRETWVPGASTDAAKQLAALGLGKTIGHDVAMVATVCLLAPLVEELTFRGVLFRGMRDGIVRLCRAPLWVGLLVGLLFSSWMFVSVHASPDQIPFAVPYFVMGLVFALGYAWTGSFYVPVMIHVLNNTRAVWALLHKADASFAHPGVMVLLFASPVIAFGVTYLLGRILPPDTTTV